MMQKSFIFISLLIFIVSLGNCGKADLSSQQSSSPLELSVEVVPVRQAEWVETVVTYGTVKAQDKVDIFPRMSGKIVKLYVKEEQQVQNDELLALIDRDEIGQLYNPVPVSATAAGKIDTIYLKEGAKVSPMIPILSITKREDLKVTVSVFETELTKLQAGQEAFITLDALPGREFKGKVSLIKSNLNIQNSKGIVEITFEQNYPEIIAGMFARVRIAVNRRNTFIIPPEALKKIEGKTAVYLAKNNIAVLRFIEIGQQRTDAVEIKNGIADGEIVISFASEELKDGIRIKIIEGK